MNYRTRAGIFAGKFASLAIKHSRLGAGSTWPGHIALRLNTRFIKDLLHKKDVKIILIAGTNGKTTTSKLIRHILENTGHSVFQNEEGANLLNGIATSLLRKSTITGRIPYDVAIFEVDENNLPHVLKQITPAAVVLLNLFRDQLDRYGEVHTIAKKWQEVLTNLPSSTKIVLNADDPEIRYLVKHVNCKTFYFSIPSSKFTKKKFSHDIDSVHCPECGTALAFTKIAYSHLGKYSCPNCGFTNQNIKISDDTIPQSLFGTYNLYNISAAIKTVQELFSLEKKDIYKSLENFSAAFGRQEKITYKNHDIFLLLSKNPAGFNQSIDVIKDLSPNPNVLIALNDRIPDGRDVSWIWDVDFENLSHARKILVTGDRAHDIAVRIKYAVPEWKEKLTVFENTHTAVNELITETPDEETAFILPTYSAMLEIRKILTGKEIL